MAYIHVILSGGVGSSVWSLLPMSAPKQYRTLSQGKNAFQLCVERNRSWSSHQVVVGNKNNQEISRNNMKEIGVAAYADIIETSPRNTASSIAFAALSCQSEDILIVTPADHYIDDLQKYNLALERGVVLAEEGFLVAIGVPAVRAETGFGYIEYNGEDVIRFKEKPERSHAEELITASALWNTGIYCFRAGVFLKELNLHQPLLYEAARNAWTMRVDNIIGEKESGRIPALSVDYAVMEHASQLKVVKAGFEWHDLHQNPGSVHFLEPAMAI